MEGEILKKLEEQDIKIEAIWKSVEKTRKYFLFTLWVSILMFVLPLLGLMFAIPFFLNTISKSMEGLL
ncbi:MAG: hypothetical protein WC682_04310 [Parcubacteria group bacterium]|jgi:hypothetical protein